MTFEDFLPYAIAEVSGFVMEHPFIFLLVLLALVILAVAVVEVIDAIVSPSSPSIGIGVPLAYPRFETTSYMSSKPSASDRDDATLPVPASEKLPASPASAVNVKDVVENLETVLGRTFAPIPERDASLLESLAGVNPRNADIHRRRENISHDTALIKDQREIVEASKELARSIEGACNMEQEARLRRKRDDLEQIQVERSVVEEQTKLETARRLAEIDEAATHARIRHLRNQLAERKVQEEVDEQVVLAHARLDAKIQELENQLNSLRQENQPTSDLNQAVEKQLAELRAKSLFEQFKLSEFLQQVQTIHDSKNFSDIEKALKIRVVMDVYGYGEDALSSSVRELLARVDGGQR